MKILLSNHNILDFFLTYFYVGVGFSIIPIIVIISQWIIFNKAEKPGWAAIVPIYNVIIFLKVVGKPWWRLFFLFVPVVNIIILIWLTNLLAKSFGKDAAFTIGLLILSFIFYPILAIGSAKYQDPAGNKINNE